MGKEYKTFNMFKNNSQAVCDDNHHLYYKIISLALKIDSDNNVLRKFKLFTPMVFLKDLNEFLKKTKI